jgi:ATP-dependent DNA helicase RecQ
MSCVKRTGERYGVKTIVDTLRGSKNEKLLRLQLDKQSTYGLMAGLKEHRIREIINFLVLNEYLAVTVDQYPVVYLKGQANRVLFGGEQLTMKLVKEERPPVQDQSAKGKVATGRADLQLFDILRELRSQIAKKQNVPAYVVFSNAALTDMCVRLPRTNADFLEVSGVGQAKLEKYGQQFLSAISAYISAKS